MADALKRELGLTAELVVGDPGEFTLWVGPTKVAAKQGDSFPTDRAAVDAVRGAIKN
ncbi:MAG TPA: hypothetical protein VEN81_13785 [Planctomycetota bacterium]|nr:hypothetical protein [Planctomycetota bacterium]